MKYHSPGEPTPNADNTRQPARFSNLWGRQSKSKWWQIIFSLYILEVCVTGLLCYLLKLMHTLALKRSFRNNGFAAHCFSNISVGAVAFQVCGRWQCDDVVVHVFTVVHHALRFYLQLRWQILAYWKWQVDLKTWWRGEWGSNPLARLSICWHITNQKCSNHQCKWCWASMTILPLC